MVADLDTFFVSVEMKYRPELRGLPVLLGKSPQHRGIVATCSYEARALGFKTGMAMFQAYELIAQLKRQGSAGDDIVCLHDNLHGGYTEHSQMVEKVLARSVPVCIAHSIDEFELDLTGCEAYLLRQFGGIVPFARGLVEQVRDETGLPISIGIGPSRIVAKMASRHAKPNGVFEVLPGSARAFLGSHAVEKVPGIGPATTARLQRLGIERVDELLSKPMVYVRHICGVNLARLVDMMLRGDADSKGYTTRGGYSDGGARALSDQIALRGDFNGDWATYSPGMSLGNNLRTLPKSIGHEKTLSHDTTSMEVMERLVWRLTEDAGYRLRAVGLCAREMEVRIRYSDFHSIGHIGSLREPSDADTVLFTRAMELLREALPARKLAVRLLGVRLQKLCAGGGQGVLFETREDRRRRELFRTVDKLRDRYGRDTLLIGPGVYKCKRDAAPPPGTPAEVSLVKFRQG